MGVWENPQHAPGQQTTRGRKSIFIYVHVLLFTAAITGKGQRISVMLQREKFIVDILT